MKLGVVGSREITDYKIISLLLHQINEIEKITQIVSGGARGVDKLAERYANENNISTKIFYADWNLHGKAAGFIRNTQIVDYSDYVVAFWDEISHGTADSIEKSKKQNKLIGIKIIR